MNDRLPFESAVDAITAGDVGQLKTILTEHPELVTATDDSNATLLIRLIDWPGHHPHSAESARVLIEGGADVDARRDTENGTPLSGALCTEESDLIRVLVEAGADLAAPCGWQPGTVLEQANQLCENYHRAGDEALQQIAQIMSEAAGRPVPNRTPMGGTVPLLFVSDFEASLKYYTEQLGFRLAWRIDDNPDDPYGSIGRGNAEFHLTVCKCDENVHVGRLFVRIAVMNVDALHAEFKSKQVANLTDPKEQPWGLREFEVLDADENRLVFYMFN